MIEGVDTQRLLLRPLTTDEVDAIVAGERRPEWSADYPTDGDIEVAAYLNASGAYEPDDLGPRQIIEIETRMVIGGVGFFGGPDPDGVIRVGYGIVAERRGRGLATEALTALLDVAARGGRVRTVTADTALDNRASQRVLEKAGFTRIRSDATDVHFAVAVR